MSGSTSSVVETATKALARLRSEGKTTLDAVQIMRADLRQTHSYDETEDIIGDVLAEDWKYRPSV